jgi:putative SOS response-associated peptidase YedK
LKIILFKNNKKISIYLVNYENQCKITLAIEVKGAFMCGRFLIDYEFRDLIDKYNLAKYQGSMKKGEIFPSQKIMTIVQKYAIAMHWGFDFKWSSRSIINARAETIFEKKTFKNLVKSKRCIIPASAYFEWQKKNDQKIKHKIFDDSKNILSLAGLYQVTKNETSEKIYQFTILTKEADEKIRNIHHRMPVIIEEADIEEWLFSETFSHARLLEMMNNVNRPLSVKVM